MALTAHWARIGPGHFEGKVKGIGFELRRNHESIWEITSPQLVNVNITAGSLASAKTKAIKVAEGKRVVNFTPRRTAMEMALEKAGVELPKRRYALQDSTKRRALRERLIAAKPNGHAEPKPTESVEPTHTENAAKTNGAGYNEQYKAAQAKLNGADHPEIKIEDDATSLGALEVATQAAPDSPVHPKIEGSIAFTIIGDAKLEGSSGGRVIEEIRRLVGELRRFGNVDAEVKFQGTVAFQ